MKTDWSNTAAAVHEFIRQNRLILPGEHLIAAFSGGADSMALLHILHELAQANRWTVTACHINHGLRPDADACESDLCAETAARLGFGYSEISWKGCGNSENQEASARDFRYETLEALRRKLGAQRILTGHHADDQAETVLYRLLKGTGLTGLAGIHPRIKYVSRPLLCLTRHDILNYLKQRDIPFASDASNLDEQFMRNRIRHTLLPFFRDKGFNDVTSKLNRLADDAARSRRILDSMLDRAWKDLPVTTADDESFRIPRDAWNRLSQDIQTELLERIFRKSDLFSGHVSAASREQMLRFMTDAQKGKSMMLRGVRIIADTGFFTLEKERCTEIKPVILSVGNSVKWQPWITIAAAQNENPEIHAENPCREDFTDDLFHIKVYIRQWRHGDRMSVMGSGTGRVSDLLKDAGVPAVIREIYPVICAGDTIIWIPAVRRSDRYLLKPGAQSGVTLSCKLKEDYYDIIRQKIHH